MASFYEGHPFQLLEINVISAQDLFPASRSMHTYAIAWVHPSRKLSTRVDTTGHTEPTWNDKFVFRVHDDFLRFDTSAINIEIYSIRCFRDALVGTVRILVSNLIPPHLQNHPQRQPLSFPTRSVALQIRRPSGRPQGILNIGVALLDGTMRSMPLYTQLSTSAVAYRDLMAEPKNVQEKTAPLRRSKSEFQINKAEDYTYLKVAPDESVGEVMEIGSSILEGWSVASSGGMEDLKVKLERWRTEMSPIYDRDMGSFRSTNYSHTRRKTDGGGGLFACFGDSFGCECSISCGLSPSSKKKAAEKKIHVSPSDGNLNRLFTAHPGVDNDDSDDF